MPYTVYKHTTPSGKIYYGITSRSVQKRIYGGYKCNMYFSKAIEKYGWDSIDTEIVAEGLTKEAAELYESYLIASYETQDRTKGYNIESGGLAQGFSPETREKISKAAKERHRPTKPETKKLLQQKSKTRRAVRCTTTGDIYLSIKAAARANGCSPKSVANCCKKHWKTKAGLRFEFI